MRAVDVTGLSHTYPGGKAAVRDVAFHVDQGECFGFLGPNGAGKTTTIKMLATLLAPDAGHATVNGFDVAAAPRDVRASIGYTAQDTSVDPQLTAKENVRLACEMYRVPRAERAERVAELLRLVDLEDVADKRAASFSGGMRKRLDIATSLVHRPPLLFLDEPTTGLDPKARLNLWEYFRALNDAGTTIFLTTQYLEEADRLCDRLAVIADGRIVATGTPDELKASVGGDALDVAFEDATPELVARAQSVVAEALGSAAGSVGVTPTGVRVTSAKARRIGTDLLLRLKQEGFTVTHFNVQSPTLDDVFLNLTGGTLAEAEARAKAAAAPARGRA